MPRRTLSVLALLAGLVASCGSSPIEPQTTTGPDTPARAAAAMTRISPTTGPVGTVVTITGTGFQARGNHLKFGTGFIKDLPSKDGGTLTFTVPDGLDLCSPEPGGPCPGGYPQTRPGDYAITVVGQGGAALTFTVTRP